MSLLAPISTASGEDSPLDFSRDIRPIFSNKCFGCHGPDQETREGGFRLDIKASAFGPADSDARPVVPGDIEASELWQRISSDGDNRMPPDEADRRLTSVEKKRIRAWIEQGAPWQEHWAFVTPRRPDSPPVPKQHIVRNPIDRFVLARLRSSGLKPSPPADRSTLIRRLSFDLTGLPPTPDQVDAFLTDPSPAAYEHLVDRLLDSPHYGEQMATDWLDAARFADTNGYQNDFARKMWPWRDWVIEAFNQNMPFDQFTIEQLAGDLLNDPTLNQRIATGFNRNHRTVTEGGSIEEEWHVENVVDRVETTATTFLGLTMGCARCHDHKYDPISQREFYEFFAYFNSVNEKGFHSEVRGNVPPLVRVVSDERQKRLDVFAARLVDIRERLDELAEFLPEQQKDWESTFASKNFLVAPTDQKLGLLNPDAPPCPTAVTQRLETLDSQQVGEGSVFGPTLNFIDKRDSHVDLGSHFAFTGQQAFSCSVWVRPDKTGAILSRMDADNDYRGFDMLVTETGQMAVHLIHRWQGSAIKVLTKSSLALKEWNHVAVVYDGSQKASGFQIYLDNRRVGLTVEHDSLAGETTTDHPLWLGRRTHVSRFVGQMTDVRLYDRMLAAGDVSAIYELAFKQLIDVPPSDRSTAQNATIARHFSEQFAPEYTQLQQELAKQETEKQKYKKEIPTVMVMEELPDARPTYVLKRGQYDKPDKDQPVEPAVPDFLPQPKSALPQNRLGLARWLVDPNHPLTARVTVNRFWQHYFGIGLVETAENFGVQSPLPSHPDLLDWLATEFIASGWNVKALQKLIVMSATYRQSSRFTPETMETDPENRLLARGPRFRLPAEAIRDNALAVSGLLVRRIGGRSIKPYQPDGVWEELAGGAGEGPYVQDTDENLYRRSLYIYRKRTVPHPTMATFDAPSREFCQVARQRTNTPLQALALLNGVTYHEAARELAVLTFEEGGTEDEGRLVYAFRRTTSRHPSDRELQVLRDGLKRYRENFANDHESAEAYTQVGDSKPDSKYTTQELAPFAAVASVILNLDETITKE